MRAIESCIFLTDTADLMLDKFRSQLGPWRGNISWRLQVCRRSVARGILTAKGGCGADVQSVLLLCVHLLALWRIFEIFSDSFTNLGKTSGDFFPNLCWLLHDILADICWLSSESLAYVCWLFTNLGRHVLTLFSNLKETFAGCFPNLRKTLADFYTNLCAGQCSRWRQPRCLRTSPLMEFSTWSR